MRDAKRDRLGSQMSAGLLMDGGEPSRAAREGGSRPKAKSFSLHGRRAVMSDAERDIGE
jgi:hypothetical protein